MDRRIRKKPVMIVLTVSLVLSACCSSDSGGNSGRLKLSPIYGSALGGALLGIIIGSGSDEEGEGAAIGAAIFGVGALLEQTDKMSDKHREKKYEHEEEQEVVVQIPNDNGSLTPVVLEKKGGVYIGPNGEHYKRLPTAEQLKPVYGL